MLRVVSLYLVLLFSVAATAQVEVFEFSREDYRLRYNQLAEELRCPKCLNQSIAGSNAPMALQLRKEVHRLLELGKTDEEIKEYLVYRFGDFVLYRPQLKKTTYALWFGPLIMALLALLIFATVIWRRRKALANASDELDEDLLAQAEVWLSSDADVPPIANTSGQKDEKSEKAVDNLSEETASDDDNAGEVEEENGKPESALEQEQEQEQEQNIK